MDKTNIVNPKKKHENKINEFRLVNGFILKKVAFYRIFKKKNGYKKKIYVKCEISNKNVHKSSIVDFIFYILNAKE